ncbi:CPBP family glutamic-type intramembrane protease [Crossiella sp. CA-258035]|uniref:CPBP family glutamic-type intramembrane protease n=1 Tax=Crossiella sp. CA-258035 TaxID=2981138 RepID=UPI0024BC938F|nr:CPBP family glutamic-type intramembrane protease [Crossiella sp. CA-258035]WHT22617.1 CPBP family glutamic-type intramembrane protease [Crossiella sp. CA-258035]
MVEAIALGLSAPLLVWLFLRYRRIAYPAVAPTGLPGRPEALRQARNAVQRLCGVDVEGWRAFATLWFDGETVDKLHQLGAVDRQHGFLQDWGLRGSWRIRFLGNDAGARGSILVGISADGAVLLFDIDGPVRQTVIETAAREAALSSPELRARLDGAGGRRWRTTTPSGHGDFERADGDVESLHRFRATGPDVRIDLSAETVGGAVLRVDSVIEVVGQDVREVERAEQREALASVGGLLGAVLALVTGVAILAFAGGRADPYLVLALAGPVLLAVLVNERAALENSAVNAYDGRLSWSAFRTVNVLMSAVTGIVSTAVVVVAALAGLVVADRIGLPLLEEPVRQLVWGGWIGLVWLGLGATGYALLRNAGIATISAAPDRGSLRHAGVGVGGVLGVTVQSAISEEVVFRLLGVAVLVWLTGSPWVAAVATAVLWAAMHSGSAFTPRWVRMGELVLVGAVLGVVVVELGLLAALVAHAVFNAVSLVTPLLVRDRPAPAARHGVAVT